jgi:hypothetical protein
MLNNELSPRFPEGSTAELNPSGALKIENGVTSRDKCAKVRDKSLFLARPLRLDDNINWNHQKSPTSL